MTRPAADRSTSDAGPGATRWQDVRSSEDVTVDLARLEVSDSDELRRRVEGALNVLSIRRALMERERDTRKAQGSRLRATAEVQSLRARLEGDDSRRKRNRTAPADRQEPTLTDAQRLDIEGRLEMAQADADYCRAVIEQYAMETEVYRRALRSD